MSHADSIVMSHADVTDVSRADATDVSHFQGVSSPRHLASLAAEFVGNPLCYPELWPAEVSQCVCVCLRACVRVLCMRPCPCMFSGRVGLLHMSEKQKANSVLSRPPQTKMQRREIDLESFVCCACHACACVCIWVFICTYVHTNLCRCTDSYQNTHMQTHTLYPPCTAAGERPRAILGSLPECSQGRGHQEPRHGARHAPLALSKRASPASAR